VGSAWGGSPLPGYFWKFQVKMWGFVHLFAKNYLWPGNGANGGLTA